MLHFFFGSIFWKLGGLIFGIATYEVIRYLVIDKVRQIFGFKKKNSEPKI